MRIQDIIFTVVCNHLETTIQEIKMNSKTLGAKKDRIKEARKLCMYLLRKHTSYSLKTIGVITGGRDHSTVIHAIDTVGDKIFTDLHFKRQVRLIEIDIENKLQSCLAA